MNVPQVNISNISQGRRFVTSLAGKTLLPLIMLEGFVEAGRTYQAYKRGGFTEARERITEEFLSALCWFGTIPLIDKIIDNTVGKKILKLPKESFDVGVDSARDSMKNYILKHPERFKSLEEGQQLLSKYRVGKIATAIASGVALVGLALPKFNQALTKMLSNKNSNNQTVENQNKSFVAPTIDKFINNSKSKKDVAFTGNNLMGLLNFVENSSKFQLISEDVGVTTGRSYSARNKYERNEILFRDIASSFFYMFNMPVWAAVCNKIQHGEWTRLDAVSAEMTEKHLTNLINENGGKMSIEAFEKNVFGDNQISNKVLNKINNLKDGRIELSKFNKILDRLSVKNPELKNNVEALKVTAEKMSGLQPELAGKKILTAAQLKDLLKGGYINSPEYMHDLYKVATTKDHLFKPNKSTYQGLFDYVSEKSILGNKKKAVAFVKGIVSKAKKSGSEITADMIIKASKNNYRANAFNMISGFAISALFLSTLIPKMQYLLTKKATGTNEFPGTAEYDNLKNNKTKQVA